MKPCSNHRKPIAWLAVGALDARQDRDLRAHLETCEGCRRYLKEISTITEKLAAPEIRTDIQTSESFHQRVIGALRPEASAWPNLLANLRGPWLNWRVAVPAIGTAALLVVALSIFVRNPNIPSPSPTPVVAVSPKTKTDFDPTVLNYQMVANRSLEKLDELLTSQGSRTPAPSPIYTASPLARDGSD
jgi:hypothetical protein